MVNSVDPDQMLHSAASDQGLHCSFWRLSKVFRVDMVCCTIYFFFISDINDVEELGSNASECNHGPFHILCQSLSLYNLTNEPRHTKTCLWAYADSEGPDQPALPHILIMAFAVR